MFTQSKINLVGFDHESSSELEKIKRRLNFLYATAEGTCPGDRNFGLNQKFIDFPPAVAENLFVLEITKKTKQYEPGVVVESVTFKRSEDGAVITNIYLKKSSEESEEEDEE